ncbi:MAG: RidA family protein [Sutterella wadsworthensis]
MKFVQPLFKGENKGHYTPGIISKGMLYVSGQLSIDPDTREVCRGDIRDHARLALDNVDRVLKEAGVRRDQVVYCRVYTTKGEYWGPINEVYAEFFGAHKPGRLVATVPELHLRLPRRDRGRGRARRGLIRISFIGRQPHDRRLRLHLLRRRMRRRHP